MEIETLKEIWIATNKEESQASSDREILEMLHAKSNGLIARMKRNLLLELMLVIVSFSGVTLYYFTAFNGRLRQVAWVYILLALAFVIYYYHKNKLLKEMQCITCRVRSNLQMQVRKLEQYLRFYLFAGTLMVPILMILFFVMFMVRHWWPGLSQMHLNSSLFATLAYFLIMIGLTVLTWFVNKWYLNCLYGCHIRNLKSVLEEMNEEETEL